MNLQIAVATAMALAVPCSGVHGATIGTVTIPASIFDAHWNDRIKTSGGELLGVMAGAPAAVVGDPDITIGGIAGTDRTICVTIRQVSGAYRAYFSYRNPKLGHTVRFVLPREKIRVTGLPGAEMAILARASASDQCTNRDPVLPATWTASVGSTLMALVNDHQADRSRTVRPTRAGDCQPLDHVLPGRSLTVYQVACSLPMAAGSCNTIPLAIQLENGGEVAFIEAAVRGACP